MSASDRSTDMMPAVQPKADAGVTIKAAGHKWLVPWGKLFAVVVLAASATYGVIETRANEDKAWRADVEKRLLAAEHSEAMAQAMLSEVRSQGTRIEARVAEIQTILMSRRY